MGTKRNASGKARWKTAFTAVLAAAVFTALAVRWPVAVQAAARKVTPQVTLSKTSFTYNGKTQKPSVTVKINGEKAHSSVYSVTYPEKSVNAGTYSVKVVLKRGYSGSNTVTYKINPVKPKTVHCLFDQAELKYTGKSQKARICQVQAELPSGNVKILSKSDYSASVPSGKKEGTYKFKIKLKGNYTGSFEAAYKITKNGSKEPYTTW